MNNENDILERQLEKLGESLQNRPSITDQVLEEIKQAKPTELVAQSREEGLPNRQKSNFRRLAMAAALVVIACCLGIVLVTILSRPNVSWAQVAQAVQEQEWIRGTIKDKNGHRTIWISPQNKSWAFEFDNRKIFCDQNENIKYEYSVREQTITKLPLGSEVIERVLPIAAISQQNQDPEPWLFGTEKVVSHKRHVVSEKGKKWIEFEMELFRGSLRQAKLRVDPKTKLPVQLVFSSKEETETAIYNFDYPPSGPSSIYSLGAPRTAKIVDLIPDKKVQELMEMLARNRRKIGDFRMVVSLPADRRALVVWKKGKKWRVDSCYWQKNALTPDLSDEGWFEGGLPGVHKAPLYVCDGRSVWQNLRDAPGQTIKWIQSKQIGPQDLMSGAGMGTLSAAPYTKIASLLYPSIEARKHWQLSIDDDPKESPGKILIKQSAEIAGGKSFGHNWYYVNPRRGFAVERIELFQTKERDVDDLKNVADRYIIIMNDFFQSKDGDWLCRQVTFPSIETGRGTANYHFDFATPMNDDIFKLPDQ